MHSAGSWDHASLQPHPFNHIRQDNVFLSLRCHVIWWPLVTAISTNYLLVFWTV